MGGRSVPHTTGISGVPQWKCSLANKSHCPLWEQPSMRFFFAQYCPRVFCTNFEVKPSEHPARPLNAGKTLKKLYKVFQIPNQHQLAQHRYLQAESKNTWHVHLGTLQEQTSDLWWEIFGPPRALVKWLASVWCLGVHNANWSHSSPHNAWGAAQGLPRHQAMPRHQVCSLEI